MFVLAVHYINEQRCACRTPVLPQDYFIVETVEEQLCTDEQGESRVSKRILQGQVQYGNN